MAKRFREVAQPVAFKVMATVDDGHGHKSLRQISRRFQLRQAAEEFVELCKTTYPDAYIAAVNKRDGAGGVFVICRPTQTGETTWARARAVAT